MMQLSRRTVIGGGATLAGAGAVAHLTARSHDSGPADLAELEAPFMLSVTDAAAGEVEILVGEDAITFTDRDLVARLARAAAGGRR